MSYETVLEPVSNAHEVEMTKVAQRCIMATLDHSRASKFVLVEEGGSVENAPTIELPPPQALRAIADLLGLMAQQVPITLIPQKHEVTTQEAASILNVSRPFVIKQIESGLLRCTKVGQAQLVQDPCFLNSSKNTTI
jgi:excisionase family DNA binding protein